ncbi:hypothetical protein JRO89_XS07G0227000 [Xanthoceras sorbifolium]|uniref:Uncharacterized protein n=1 Tax=Xanthoceras sorbifolium TaxID=99658 RepID=A0ABQ8HUL7_9ROSI|nr:hypothetical protein JRO89_XS07G0227000 [Xanthoceras sorbifolium]
MNPSGFEDTNPEGFDLRTLLSSRSNLEGFDLRTLWVRSRTQRVRRSSKMNFEDEMSGSFKDKSISLMESEIMNSTPNDSKGIENNYELFNQQVTNSILIKYRYSLEYRKEKKQPTDDRVLTLSAPSRYIYSSLIMCILLRVEKSKICTMLSRCTYAAMLSIFHGDLNKLSYMHGFSVNIIKYQLYILCKLNISFLLQKMMRFVRESLFGHLLGLGQKRRQADARIKNQILCRFLLQSSVTSCSLIAITAIVLAAHSLTALLMGPLFFSFPTKCFKKKLFRRFRCLRRSGLLKKVREQLDVAAKGTYILNRDFDTIGRLVARLHDEVEHNKAMMRLCLERSSGEERFSLHVVVNELKKSSVGFQMQVEELEEHVYLCLVSINRARALLIKEMTKSCVQESS